MISAIFTGAPHHAHHAADAKAATNASKTQQAEKPAEAISSANEPSSVSVSGGAATRSSAAVLAALNNLTAG